MSQSRSSRREFLKSSAAAAAAAAAFNDVGRSSGLLWAAPNDRPRVGCIGTGDRWNAVGPNAMAFGDVVAVCDVDSAHTDKAVGMVKERQGAKGRPTEVEAFGDYRKLLERNDIDIITVVTTDHWHVKIAIEALKAGKDVYCEKPLTLTIDEGKKIREVLEKTKRVMQVGTQQRSEMGNRFLTAVALVKDGRIGDVQKVTCVIGGVGKSGPLPKAEAPKTLDWEKWLGQAPLVDYVSGPVPMKGYPKSRCHYEFRWWYEYSGGKMTDWGAHHVDIAQWAIGMGDSGPLTVEGTAEHPVPLEKGMPTVDNEYNVASKFDIQTKFPNGVEVLIKSDGENGILFEGTKGRFFVSRGALKGAPVEELASKPLPEALITEIYKGKKPGNHMQNFFECVVDRTQPISDVPSHHRAMTTCHLANIAIRLGRKLQWDPKTEQIVNDPEANAWQSREQRKGYEVTT
ncbi:MAG TPA: Gfo/Idh/MocA family oxidoreductase [Pirellulales bacterium]